MSAENAKNAAERFVSQLRLPQPNSRLKFKLVIFESDEDCRFLYPRRALEWQRQVNTYISRALRQKGFRVQRVTLRPSDYEQWRQDREDTDQLRRAFADQHAQFIAPEDC